MDLANPVVRAIRPHIPDLRRRYGITRLRVYGSAARGDDHADSDVDVIAEFAEVPDLFIMGRLAGELEHILGRRVDLTTPGGLHPRVRREADREGVDVTG